MDLVIKYSDMNEGTGKRSFSLWKGKQHIISVYTPKSDEAREELMLHPTVKKQFPNLTIEEMKELPLEPVVDSKRKR